MVLMRSTDGHQLKQPQQPNPLATKRQQQQQQPEGKLRQQQSDNGNDLDGQDGPNRTRQLVRVYTASKEVVEEIAAATEHHLATDRLYPVKNHHHSHHKYRRRRPNHHHQNHHHHHHPLRPSMLIELRQLQYVREYHLPVRSQLLRVRCDVFEPAESIYYCFIYVVLHRGAVHFESLPYCVPTTLEASSTAAEDDDDEEAVVKGGDNGDDQSMMMKRKSRRQKQRKIMMRRRGPALSGVNNRISGNGGNGRRPLYPFLIDPPSTPSENEQQQKQKQKQQQQHLITLGRADLIANDSSSSSSPTQKWYQMNDDHRQSGGQQHYSLQTDNSISEHFNNNAERKASADEAGAIENDGDYDYDPLQQIRSLIPPPGPAAFGSARTRKDEEESEDQMNSLPPDNAVDYEETAELDHRSTKEKEDNNIRQFALKSSDSLPSSSSSGSSSSLQSDYHRQQQQQQSPIVVGQRIGGNNGNNNNSKGDKVATQRKRTKTKKTPALSVQRRSCYCSNSADLRPSSSTSPTSILRLNLTTSETTVLHLVITSCPAASEEEEEDEDERKEIQNIDNSSSAVADDDENLLDSSGENAAAANYISGSSESGRHLKEAEVITTTTTSTAKTTADKEATKANNNKTKKDRRKGKGKKERKDRKNHHQPTEPLSTTSTTTTTTSTTSTTTTEASTSSSTLPSSATTTPTVCILSIENPLQYSFKLDSIEPSLDWPAGIFDGHSMQGGGLDLPGPEEQGGMATGEGQLDFLDWLRRFPFLVVRSGQRAIDPQMNIENRSATHFLRSGGHLRFEALSSLNVTLRFRRSPQPTLAHTRDSQHTTLQHRQSSELGEEDSSSSWSSAFHSVRSAVNGAISYFAYHLAVNSAGDSGQPRTSDGEDSAALAQLTAFHLTSMLLSLFILATLAIFAVIAYLQASKEEEGTRRVQIRTPQEEEEFDMDSSPRHHSQQQSSRASEDQQMMQQLYGSSSQQASISKSKHQTIKSPSFTLEQQSLEMDYYDYVAPLTIVEHHHHHQQQNSTYETLTNHQQQQQQTLEHTSTADSSSTCHHFRTLPIKVNSPSSSLSRNKQLSLVKQNNTTTTSSCCSLAAAAASGNGGGTSLVRAGGGGGGQSSAACSAAGAQSTSGYVINDHNSQQQQQQQLQQPNSNSGSSTEAERMVATLARLSFTKPPVLLSTFRPSAGAGE